MFRLVVLCLVLCVGVVEAGWYMTTTYADANCAGIGVFDGRKTDVCYRAGNSSIKYFCSSGEKDLL